ncbi:TOTE conflict system archaeo-eukaryotic primase domain-containing protein [Pseudosporangium ferrugineum]|uniref:TOTE conflict system archaeo-eukaryotic primase domain-containing protein n=1 Tax=Pseudosporangium ferrugineum TaxID=439699 RepID=UPI001FE475A6|nr:DEAD/DEAH box helicase family protein [Pseudosporangium ferrugineum]
MVLRGSMDLRSYDRLFPNQDVLPDRGLGNLIAAPLQGRRRKDGLTLFVNLATLEPHEDQWTFLSVLDRLSPGDAERVARRAKQTVVGAGVAKMSRSDATKIHPPLPMTVQADLAAGLRIDISQLPPAALTTFKHAASLANPKFYELQRLRKSTWDTPRFLRGYNITLDGRLVLPRGLRHTVGRIVEDAGSRLVITDTRDAGREIEVAFTAELTTRQSAAVSAMLAHDDGMLVAPPGSGKTVIACAMIAERATSTLILVDRKALAEQWRSRIEQFLRVQPGQIGGGRRKLTGVVDVAMLPSLTRRADVADLTAGYGHVIVDECHHLAAAAYDHAAKRIGAQFWLGLTATPTRRDSLGELGMDRRTAAYLPLTAEVVAAHLVGDVFMGLYPLLTENTCQFLAADFDGSTAMLDALAYCKAARASGVPAALEISQSGRGAHAWIFFADPIPDLAARPYSAHRDRRGPGHARRFLAGRDRSAPTVVRARDPVPGR